MRPATPSSAASRPSSSRHAPSPATSTRSSGTRSAAIAVARTRLATSFSGLSRATVTMHPAGFGAPAWNWRMSMPFLIVRSLEPAIPCARESPATSSETHTNRSTSLESCRKMAVCRRVASTSRPCRVCTTIGTRASQAAGPA